MKLREATVQDVDAVVDLVTAMLREMASYGGRALGEEAQVKSLLRTRFTDSLEKDNHAYLLAPVEGAEEELAGIVEASIISPYAVFQPKPLVHVHSLYVLPRYRGERIGRRLLEEVLDWGKRRGCTEAELNVLACNPARELYESLGFEIAELEMRLDL
jgi:GNAT superfamily N-acetyltransferase